MLSSLRDREGLGKIFEDSLLEEDANESKPTLDAKHASYAKEIRDSLMEGHSQLHEILSAKEKYIRQILASRQSVQTQKPRLVHKSTENRRDRSTGQGASKRADSLDSADSDEDMLMSSKMYKRSPHASRRGNQD